MFEYSRGHAQATGGIGIGWKPGGLRRSSALVVGDRAEASFEGTLTRGTPGESSRLRLVRGDEVVLDETRSPSDDYVESFFLLQQEYARAMRTGAPVTQTAAEGYRTLRAVFAAYASIDERRIVDLVAEREST
jgi:predicted dehydrogenase